MRKISVGILGYTSKKINERYVGKKRSIETGYEKIIELTSRNAIINKTIFIYIYILERFILLVGYLTATRIIIRHTPAVSCSCSYQLFRMTFYFAHAQESVISTRDCAGKCIPCAVS